MKYKYLFLVPGILFFSSCGKLGDSSRDEACTTRYVNDYNTHVISYQKMQNGTPVGGRASRTLVQDALNDCDNFINRHSGTSCRLITEGREAALTTEAVQDRCDRLRSVLATY